jgi:hypothetical protein
LALALGALALVLVGIAKRAEPKVHEREREAVVDLEQLSEQEEKDSEARSSGDCPPVKEQKKAPRGADRARACRTAAASV